MKRESPWPSFILAFALWLVIVVLGLWITLHILEWVIAQFPTPYPSHPLQ